MFIQCEAVEKMENISQYYIIFSVFPHLVIPHRGFVAQRVSWKITLHAIPGWVQLYL